MKCSKCGKEIDENDKFCTYCGNENKLEDEENGNKKGRWKKYIKEFFLSKTFIIYTIIVGLIIGAFLSDTNIDISFVCFLGIYCYITILFAVILPVWIVNKITTKKMNETKETIEINAEKNENITREYRKKCNVCGHIFCYTDKDVAINNERIKLANSYQARMFTQGLMRNNKIDWRYNQEKMEQSLNQIVDFSKCSKCGSTDLIDYDNEKKAEESITINSTDEIIKYKELLDKGILTQEEFDKKKKELLKL